MISHPYLVSQNYTSTVIFYAILDAAAKSFDFLDLT